MTPLALALGALAVAPAVAPAQEPDPAARAGEERAEAVLAEAQEVLAPGTEAAEPSRDPTLVLAELSRLQKRLDPAKRRAARRILARPDDGPSDRYGDGYDVDEAAESPHCDTNFCVHWVDAGPDAPDLSDSGGDPGVPDFVEETLASAQDSFTVENDDLGWEEPLTDVTRGGGGAGRTDVYLIETNGDYFGYASPDEGQVAGVTSKFGYIVLDEDFAEFTEPGFSAIDALQVTMAHEYNHILQFTYDVREDGWMLESTATWMEEQVYPQVNDYLRYVDAFADTPDVPLTQNALGLKIYGAAMWNHYLTGLGGPDVIRDAWAESDSVTPPSLSVAAYDSGLGGIGATPFDALGDAFAGFAAASAEWRALPTAFPDAPLLPDVRRSERRLKPGARATRLGLRHLSYRLFRVRPAAAAAGVTLKARGPEEVQFGLGLVARTGSATGGAVTSDTTVLDDGGGATVALPPGSYDRVTAVIANADARVNASRRYVSDDSEFKLRLVP